MKRVSRQSKEQKMIQVWWVKAILGLIFLGLAYGFASLAIDSAHLLEYAAAIVFLVWGVLELGKSARLLFNR